MKTKKAHLQRRKPNKFEKGNFTMARTRQEVIDDIIVLFDMDEDLFADCIEDLDSYNGWLGDDRYYPMCELDDFYSGLSVTEVLERAYYGYDAERWITDSHGTKEYGPFCPNREYFTFNGYGNLVSADSKDYSDYLDRNVIESMEEHRRYISFIDDNTELSDLFDKLEEAE